MRAKTCGEAANNLRLGQRWQQRAWEGMQTLVPRKLEPRHYSPTQRELVALDSQLPNAEMNAHLHRLDKCGAARCCRTRRQNRQLTRAAVPQASEKEATVIAIPDPLPDGTPLGDLQAAVQAAWMAGSHTTVVELLKRYELLDWMCPCCARLRAVRFTTANAAHREQLLIRLCASCKAARAR